MRRSALPRRLALLPGMTVLAAVLALVVAGGLGRVGAQEGATVEVTPPGAEPGEFIIVDGTGFPVGETVTVVFGEVPIATATIEGDGAFQVLAAVPLTAEAGPFVIAVTGTFGSQFVLTYQVATPAPVATVAPTGPGFEVLPDTALPGETITVTGGGFGPGESVTVQFDGVELATVGATLGGAFLANVVIPVTTTAGPHSIVVTGAEGLELTSEYVVAAPPTPTATPTPLPTAEPTVGATATPSGGGAVGSATPSAGDGTPGVPSGDGASDGGSGGDGAAGDGDGFARGTWDDLPVAFLAVMAVAAALLAAGFWRWGRREATAGGEGGGAPSDGGSPSSGGLASEGGLVSEGGGASGVPADEVPDVFPPSEVPPVPDWVRRDEPR